MSEEEYRERKLALMEKMADSLRNIATDVHNIWNELQSPKAPYG
jgi:hypothetical protein